MTRGPRADSNIPVPDPSDLTTAQIRHEIGTFREIIEARLDGMDKADIVLAATVGDAKILAAAQVGHLKDLHDERFLSVAQQFQERDIRHALTSSSAERAIDAALQAARELVEQQTSAASATAAKAEESAIKQLDQIDLRMESMQAQFERRFTDLKERVDRGEGATSGASGSRSERRLDTAQVIAVISVILGAISVAVAVVLATRPH